MPMLLQQPFPALMLELFVTAATARRLVLGPEFESRSCGGGNDVPTADFAQLGNLDEVKKKLCSNLT